MATFSDDFDRSDGAIGNGWVNTLNALVIASNRVQLAATVAASGCHPTDVGDVDMYSEADVHVQTTADYPCVTVRHSTSARTFYQFFFDPLGTNQFTIGREVAGGYGGIATQTGPTIGPVPCDVTLRLEVEGSTLRGYANGTLVVTTTSTAITTPEPHGGVTFYNDSGNSWMDNFETGMLGAEEAIAAIPTAVISLAGSEVAATGGPPPTAGYTEVEWSIAVQAPAAGDDVYQFRVFYDPDDTPLDSYPVTPQLTVSEGAETIAAIPTALITVAGPPVTAVGSDASTAAIPSALVRVGTVTPTAAGVGDAEPRAIPPAALRLVPQSLAGTGAGTATTAIPAATTRLTAQSVTGAASGTATVAVPPATLTLDPEPVVAAATGAASTAIPPAALILDGKLVLVSGADITVEIPTATLYFTAPVPGAGGVGTATTTIPPALLTVAPATVVGSGAGAVSTAVPAAQMRVAGPAVTASGSDTATVAVPAATLHLSALAVVGVTGATALIPPASLILQPRVLTVSGAGAASTAVPSALLILAGRSPAKPGIAEGLLTCAAFGPGIRRALTGPALIDIDAFGPETEGVAAAGPAAAGIIPVGPALTSKVVDGPAHHVDVAFGPDNNTDVAGPVTEQLVVAGPGACNAD